MHSVDQENQELKYIYLHYMQFIYLEEQSKEVELETYLSIPLFEKKICTLRSDRPLNFYPIKTQELYYSYFPNQL